MGIDTVKQAEIFALVRAQYALPQDQNFKLADVQSIAAIAAYVMANMPQHPAPQPPTARPTQPAVDIDFATGPFTVRQVGIVPATPLRTGGFVLRGRNIVLVGGTEPARQATREALVARGASVHALELSPSDVLFETRIANLGGQPADGVLYLIEQRSSWDAQTLESRVANVFFLARALGRGRNSNMAGAGFLVVGEHGGIFGARTQTPSSAVLGAMAGVVKSLAKEWPEARCVAIDVDQTMSPAQLAALALDEWEGRGEAEIAWHNESRLTLDRMGAVQPVSQPLAPQAVVLATGGARGVTYRLLKELAAQTPLRIVVFNRTAGVSPEDSPLTHRSEAEQKELARAAVAASGERATPAAVRRWIEREKCPFGHLAQPASPARFRQRGRAVDG